MLKIVEISLYKIKNNRLIIDPWATLEETLYLKEKEQSTRICCL